MRCLWCETEFQPRGTGGKPQKFCSAPCRRDFEAACRAYAAAEVEAGRIPVSVLRMALEQRARWLQRDLPPERGKAPEMEKCTDGPPAAVVGLTA